jgi:hypothetical protein
MLRKRRMGCFWFFPVKPLHILNIQGVAAGSQEIKRLLFASTLATHAFGARISSIVTPISIGALAML